ncbi:MAG: hypothetical protein EHM55_04240 [Acidobacteria bacterium]|nr:MAG: hypothetical protein EHM55_04240 [Acidobacteriota bacterium]
MDEDFAAYLSVAECSRSDGTVKVLDFGLAKALMDQPASNSASMSPTITSPALMTGGGVILGTAAYMSPEQARGGTCRQAVGHLGFGCVVSSTPMASPGPALSRPA